MFSRRIFVQIAGYRDPECQWTVKDLFEKAAEPDRIDVGVCWQSIAEEDSALFQVQTRPEQVKVIEIDARESKGAGHARSLVQQLYDGQRYAMQIDSHMRFEPGWDERLIRMLGECESPKPILTCYPPGYSPPDRLDRRLLVMLPKEFDKENTLMFRSLTVPPERAPVRPIRGACLGGCFVMGDARYLAAVPADPLIYFFGEEVSLAVRLFTHGWDLFYPHEIVVYHYWSRAQRRTHFDDHSDWGVANRLTRQRVAHMLGQELSTDPKVLVDLDKYGLGSERSITQWEQLACVDLNKKRVFENPLERHFVPELAQKPPTPVCTLVAPVRSPSVAGATVIVAARSPISLQGAEVATNGQLSHRPRMIFESKQATVYDDFLPPKVYDEVYKFACTTDYKFINTTGTVRKVWRLRDGFPLRSERSLFYFTNPGDRPENDSSYPTGSGFDSFAEGLIGLLPNLERMIGRAGIDWLKFSVSSWIYPRATGLSLHTDGASYAGAYVYFLNPVWNIHWGGLLMILDPETDALIEAHKKKVDAMEYHRIRWADEREENELVWEPGFAKCIFPKNNRLVVFGGTTHHMVTTVNEGAGDNVRRSFAGFFDKKK